MNVANLTRMKNLFMLGFAFLFSCANTEPEKDGQVHQEYNGGLYSPFYYDYGPGFYTDPNNFQQLQEDWFYDYSELRFRKGAEPGAYEPDEERQEEGSALPEVDFDPNQVFQ